MTRTYPESITAVASIEPPPLPGCRSEGGLQVHISGWSCRLRCDTPEDQELLAELLAPLLAQAGPVPESGIEVEARGGGPRRIRAVRRGTRLGFEKLIPALDQKSFTRFPHPTRVLLGDARIADTPILELADGDLLVLRDDLWPVYVQNALMWLLLQEHPVVSLHAATSAMGDRAIVLIGPSGAGKSTLSLALQQAGADYYGDERAFFVLPSYALHVWPRAPRLRPGGLVALGSSVSTPEWHELKRDDPKCVVTLPEPTRPCPRDRACIVFIDGFGPEPHVEEIRAGEATRRLLHSMIYRDTAIGTWLELAAEIVDRHPCRRLTVGAPAETARLLLDHVQRME